MKMNRTQLPSRLNSQAVYSKYAAEAPTQAGGDMVIRDVRIVEEGEASGHGVWLDANFVSDTVRLAQNRRIKCRFGHPGMCSESLGTLLGYYDNFREMSGENGAYAIADLHLLQVADMSPNGKLAEYIMELSKIAPDMFGNSIVFTPSIEYYKTDKPGVKVYEDWWTGRLFDKDMNEYDEATHGTMDESKLYVDNEALHESDLVDTPAATSSLFGQPTILAQVADFFGLNMGGLRKTVLLNKLVKGFMAHKKFDINATTTDGTPIIIVTQNNFIGVGDMVTDADGNAVPDSEHAIDSSDSGQSNITITTVGGTITNIAPTAAQQDTTQQQQESNSSSPNEMNSTSIAEQLQALTASNSSMDTALSAAIKRIEKLESLPIGKETKVIRDQAPEVKTFKVDGKKYGWSKM